MYPPKVMKLFKHPKNVGEIKNADGIGEAGNMICLPPKELVVANPENKPINSVFSGERILGHDGAFHEVAEVSSRQFSGNLIRIKNCFGETRLTPEHKVLAVRVPKKNRFARTENKKKLPVEWVEAGLLSKGDLCVYPVMRETHDVLEVEVRATRKCLDFTSAEIPSKIPLNNDFLRLAGYFLSEGSLGEKTTSVHAAFTFSSKEEGLADDVVRIVNALFGIRAVKRAIPKRHTIVVQVNNVHFVRFFKPLFGNGASEKAVPDVMMRLPPEKQKELLKGLWLGDGFLNKKIPRAGYSTISRKLAEQVKMLLLRQGIAPSVYCEREKTVNGVHHRKAYRIHVGRRGAEKIAPLLGEALSVTKFVSVDAWVEEGRAFMPATSVSEEPYDGSVYNLAVEDSHSYVTPSLAVHNCGDIMRVYIKVKDGKIVDAKFRTFGCVAAIATSSMVTELAKGKTLERALEMTREEVARAVGGLPPIKLHCSVLAVDALSEAIYDYLKKNGKPLSKELRERHERIRGEAQEVEGKHREYAEMQRKAFKKQ